MTRERAPTLSDPDGALSHARAAIVAATQSPDSADTGWMTMLKTAGVSAPAVAVIVVVPIVSSGMYATCACPLESVTVELALRLPPPVLIAQATVTPPSAAPS